MERHYPDAEDERFDTEPLPVRALFEEHGAEAEADVVDLDRSTSRLTWESSQTRKPSR